MDLLNDDYSDFINAIEEKDIEYIKKHISNDAKTKILLEVTKKPSSNSLIISNREDIVDVLIKSNVDVNCGKKYSEDTRYGKVFKEEIPLGNAIESDNINIVKLLIENKAEINIKVDHSTPLCMAIENKNKEIVQYLLDNGADVNFSNENGDTPFMIAMKKNSFDIAKLLMQYKADLTFSNNRKETALMIFEFNSFGFLIGSHEDSISKIIDMMSILLDAGININACDKEGKTVLMKYVNVDFRLTKFLINNGAEINSADKDGNTPLFYAIDNFNKASLGNSNAMLGYIELLVENGADVNTQAEDGETPLMRASEKHSYKIVKFLIKKGANVNELDEKGETALLKVFKYTGFGIPSDGSTDTDIYSTLKVLLEAGADTDVKDNQGNTAFILAVKGNLSDAIKLLILHGVNITKEDIDMQSLFVKSLCHYDNFELSNVLLDNGFDINSINEEGNTPLLLAIQDSDLKIIQYLVEKKANINSQNKFGYTPLMLLIRDNPDLNIIKFMVKNGANTNTHKDELITPLTLAIIKKRESIFNILLKAGANTSSALKYLLENDLFFEKEYFEEKFEALLPEEAEYNTRLSLLESWSYFDEKIDVVKIDKCIFLLDKLKIRIGQNINRFGASQSSYELMNLNGLNDISQELINNLHSIYSTTFRDILKKFIEFPVKAKELVKILTNFTIDTPIKFTTHEWRERIDKKYINNFTLFLNDVKKQLTLMKLDLDDISPHLSKKIEAFILSGSKSEKSWYSKGDIKVSWSSIDGLEKWVNDGGEPFDFDMNSSDFADFGEIIELFKNEIEMRNNMLQDIFVAQKKRLGRKFTIHISDNLKNEKFYTDVESFTKAVDEIFKEIEKYAKINNAYKVEVELHKPTTDYIELEITHIGSLSARAGEELKERISSKGDSVELYKSLKNLCDWSIIAQSKEGSFELDCFRDNYKDLEDTPKGYTHKMRFYK